MGHQFRRAHLRAPLNSILLYEDDGHVFKAGTINISEGGVLLENLPRIPEINAMPLMINLLFLPELSRQRMDQLLSKTFFILTQAMVSCPSLTTR